jgi:hypothetical protein
MTSITYLLTYLHNYLLIYPLTYLLQGAESFLTSIIRLNVFMTGTVHLEVNVNTDIRMIFHEVIFSQSRSGDRIPAKARFSAPDQIGPLAQSASCKMGTGSFPGGESGRCVTLTSHLFLMPRSRKRVELYLYSP